MVERISQTAQTSWLTLSRPSRYHYRLHDGGGQVPAPETLLIIDGFGGVHPDTAAGTLFGKLMNAISGGKINPLLGACGISAFPCLREWSRVGQQEDPTNFLLMHAMASNTATDCLCDGRWGDPGTAWLTSPIIESASRRLVEPL